MCSLRENVKERQLTSKDYVNRRRTARVPKFQVGKYVRVKKPVTGPKGTPSFGPPLKILKRIRRWTSCLEDGRMWNASQLTAVPEEALPQHALIWDDNGHQSVPLHGSQVSLPRSPPTPDRTALSTELHLHSAPSTPSALLLSYDPQHPWLTRSLASDDDRYGGDDSAPVVGTEPSGNGESCKDAYLWGDEAPMAECAKGHRCDPTTGKCTPESHINWFPFDN
ncbi:hypothetical protein HPB49_021393 [Dermacentor silvarum]|uniref:Uncharacterized protein n=1 Tax=Dermacentor silvarum TaxID=543639 RepID=A0ACB8CMP9_DERSI|nr:hypothetical protein HPB49_021393 [Dermacentor silvarum]